MKKLNELKAERASITKKQNAIVELAKKEDRGFNAEEKTSFDGLQTSFDEVERNIAEVKQMQEVEKRMAGLAGSPVNVVKEEKSEPFSLIRAINNAKAKVGHHDAEAKAHERGMEEFRNLGKTVDGDIVLPNDMFISRAITVGDDGGTKGGALVASTPQEFMPLLPSFMLADMGVQMFTDLTGDVPLISGDEFTFSYVAETAAVTGTDAVYAGPTLSPKRLSGVVDVSERWLLQTGPSAEANLKAIIANGIETAIVKAAIAGGGTYGPTNNLYDDVTTVQAGAAGAATWDDIVGLESLVKGNNASDNAYYLFDPAMMGSLKTIKKDAGSGLFLIENGMINGKNYKASTSVGTLDAGASHPIVYGDFSQAAAGFWGGVSIKVDPYTQAASGKVRLIFNVYNDFALANEKAFATRKNLTV